MREKPERKTAWADSTSVAHDINGMDGIRIFSTKDDLLQGGHRERAFRRERPNYRSCMEEPDSPCRPQRIYIIDADALDAFEAEQAEIARTAKDAVVKI